MANNINIGITLLTSGFERSIRVAEKSLARFGRQATASGEALTQSLTAPLAGVGFAAVKSFADMEKLNKGLTAIMGTSEMAAIELEKLREVARLPGLGLKEAVQGSINLQAVGLSADEARNTMLGFGKALAAVGKGKVELEAIQYQLTQMISKNKLLAEDYKVIQSNLPLMAAGMEAAFGTNNIEAIRDTGISAKEFTLRLSEALAKLPQTQNVTGGLANAFENFSDNVFIAASELGKLIATAFNLQGVMNRVSNALEDVVKWFGDLSPFARETIVTFGAFFALLGPSILIIGKLSTGLTFFTQGILALNSAFTFLTGPVGLALLALTSLGVLVYSAYKNYQLLNPQVDTFNDYVSQGTKNIIAEQTQFNSLISIVNDANVSAKTRSRLISEINEKYGSYLPKLIDEKASIQQIKAAQEGANKAFSEKIKLTALQGIVEKQTAKLVELAQQEYEIEQQLAKQRQQVAKQLPNISNSQFTYGQASAQLTNENIQQSASLRELEKRLSNVRDAQKQLTDATAQTQNKLSKLLPNVEPTVTNGTTPTAPSPTGLPIPKIDTKALLEQEKAISNITARISALAQTAKGPFGFIRAELSKVTVLTPDLNKQKDALLEYQKAIQLVSNQAAIFGENPLEAQLGATETALKSALETFGPYSDAVRVLSDEYDRLRFTIEENDKATLKAKELQQQYAEIATTVFDTLGSSLASSISGLESFGKAAKRAFLDVFGTIINEIVLLQIRNFLASPAGAALGPVGGAIALGAGKAFGSVLKALFGTVKLAKGGLAFAPTLATVGDNPGARTDPEVIAPLSKLREYLDGGSGSMIAETRISGNDLLVLVRRAETRDGRIR